jgi:hypothetical protein
MDRDILEEMYEKSKHFLLDSISSYWFTASDSKFANYYSIWARDASITTLAALQTWTKRLVDAWIRSMKTLIKRVAENWQVPTYVEVEKKLSEYWWYWSITSVDSNLWVIITCSQVYKTTKTKIFMSDKYIRTYIKMMYHIHSVDLNHDWLLEVPEAGDWADIFWRNYHILYDQVLYYIALNHFQELLKTKKEEEWENINPDLLRRINLVFKKIPSRKFWVKSKLNRYFWLETPEERIRMHDKYMIYSPIPHKPHPFYQSHLIPFRNYWSHRFDTLWNLLAIIWNISNEERTKKIINYIIDNNVNQPIPISCLHPVVEENDKDWLEIYSIKEKPYTYHNWWIWPFITWFWIEVLFHHSSKKRIAKRELNRFAMALKENDWFFPEYFHWKTWERMWQDKLAWSAAWYIIAYNAVINDMKVFK